MASFAHKSQSLSTRVPLQISPGNPSDYGFGHFSESTDVHTQGVYKTPTL